MKLTRLEQETILSWNQAEDTANVYTASEVVARRLERRLGRPADKCTAFGWEWTIPRGWMVLPRLKRARAPGYVPTGRRFAAKAKEPDEAAVESA